MKILLVVSSYAPNVGGLQSVTGQLARALVARGHDVVVVTNRHPRSLACRETIDDVPVIRWHFITPQFRHLRNRRLDLFVAGLFYLPVTLIRLLALLRQHGPDVVNLHFVGAPALFLLVARWFRSVRLVVSLHGDDVEGLPHRGSFDRRLFRSVLCWADVVTACSRYLLELAKTIEPTVQQKGRVIYNGIDPLTRSAAQPRTGLVLATGRMVPKKGFDLLLQARAGSARKWRLALIGDGPEREALQKLTGILGLNEAVRFEKSRPRAQVLEAMAAADLVVIPSRQEPFGLVALEAMALGKPVVATRVGGLPEVLEGAEAFLTKPDGTELAEAVETALQRLECDPEFGARNIKCALRFSTEQMVSGYLGAYRV